jgi:hypothetical protein
MEWRMPTLFPLCASIIRPLLPAGPLSNRSGEGMLSGAAKGAATGAIKGLSNSLGTVGNLSNFAN